MKLLKTVNPFTAFALAMVHERLATRTEGNDLAVVSGDLKVLGHVMTGTTEPQQEQFGFRQATE